MQNLDDYPQVSHKTLQTDLGKFFREELCTLLISRQKLKLQT